MVRKLERIGTPSWVAAPLLVAAVLGVAIGLLAIRQPAPVLADDASYYLSCPTTQISEGESVDVFVVQFSVHNHPRFEHRVSLHTSPGTAGPDDYVHQDTGTIAEYLGYEHHYIEAWGGQYNEERWARWSIQTREDNLVEGPETFTLRFEPASLQRNSYLPERDNKCELTIIDDDPQVTNIEVTSTPAMGDTYGAGEEVEFAVTFNAPVDAVDWAGLGIWLDGWKGAGYKSGAGTNTLTFAYQVQRDDLDEDGVGVQGGHVKADGSVHGLWGVTGAGADTPHYPWYQGLADQAEHKVDGRLVTLEDVSIVSTPENGGDTYGAGDSVVVALTFSEAVEVDGDPWIWVRIGPGIEGAPDSVKNSAIEGAPDSNERPAIYSGQSNDNKTVEFTYLVWEGDVDDNGIAASGVGLNGGSITSRETGRESHFRYYFTHQPDHKVYGVSFPRVINTELTPGIPGGIYTIGQGIGVVVTLSGPVDVTGQPQMRVTVGDQERWAVYLPDNQGEEEGSTNTTTLVFTYVVQEGDLDLDGLSAPGSDPGDPVEDRSVNIAGTDVVIPLVFDALPDSSAHRIDGIKPTLVQWEVTSDPGPDGTYGVGDVIRISGTFSEDVFVTGSPDLSLEIGDYHNFDRVQALYSGGSGATLEFAYTVAVGDSDTDGIRIAANPFSSVLRTAADIRDIAGYELDYIEVPTRGFTGHNVFAPGGL